MRRPFLWPGLGLSLGILAGRFYAPPAFLILAFILALLPFLWILRGRRPYLPLFLLAITGLGMVRIQQVQRVSPNELSLFAQGGWAVVEGKVVSLPESNAKGRRNINSFVLEAESLFQRGHLYEVRGRAQVFLFQPASEAPYGSRVRLRGKLTLPKKTQNPGEFDYRRYLAEQGIRSLVEGYGPRSLRILEAGGEGTFSPLVGIQKLRKEGAGRFDRLFPFPMNVLLKALILGIRKGLPEDLRDDFMKTGTTHLVAISGMNITLVAGSLFLLCLSTGLPQKGAAVCGILTTVAYVFLSGAGIPVVRAGWMACLFFTGLLLERQKDLLNTLFFALCVILVADPAAFFQVGFQLSFLSVLSLLLFSGRSQEEGITGWFQTGTVLLGTFPLVLVYFNVFSGSSLLANLLAVPLFHLGVLGGWASLILGPVPWLGPLLIRVSSIFLQAGLAWIRFWAGQPWGYFYVRPPSWPEVAFYYAMMGFVCLVFRPGRMRLSWLRALSISCWLLAAALFFLPPPKDSFALTAFSVGQNEILHAVFPGGRHWLVNSGRKAPSDQARWTLAPFLKREGVKHLQGICLTDLAKRHAGGIETLFSNFSVGTLLVPGPLRDAGRPRSGFGSAPPRPRNLIFLHTGDHFPISPSAGIRVLSVEEGYAFLLFYFQGHRFLLLPTWKPEVLKRALPKLKALPSVDVLILPAQGKPLETQGQETLSSLLPAWVVLAKPQPWMGPMTEFLRSEEIPVLYLSETGALRFAVHGKEWRVSAHG